MVKVLALVQDRDCVHYATEDDYYFSTSYFMEKCLLKPHSEEYVMRYIYLFFDEDKFNEAYTNLFCDMATISDEEREKRNRYFNSLWEFTE